MSDVDKILEEREKTHGDFSYQAVTSQALKEFIRTSRKSLTNVQQEALEMIMHKIARILEGNPGVQDHWDDIAGYATLASREIAQRERNERKD